MIQYSDSERIYWVLRFIEGRSDVTQAAGCPVARAGMQMFRRRNTH